MKNRRFLIVDDEQVADFVRVVIELEGGTAVVAPTAEQALEYARSTGPFDVMVVELALPDVSGWELMDKATALLPDCRMVIFSAQPPDCYTVSAVPPNVALSLVKPVAASTLRDALRSVLVPVRAR